MNNHPVQWAAPSPLWPEATDGPEAERRPFDRPAVFRFASDTFMEDFLAVLEKDPAQLSELVVKQETWRGPAALSPTADLLQPSAPTSSVARKLKRLRVSLGRDRSARTRGENGTVSRAPPPPLKLYQPVHQRFYLVSACLICQVPGLPDRVVDPGKQERATYVLRRLLPPDEASASAAEPTGWHEHALVVTPQGGGWQRVSDGAVGANVLVPGEEQLPLFAAPFAEDDGRRRRLWAGLIPVARRDAYLAAQQYTPSTATPTPAPAGVTDTDPRMVLLATQVIEPWKRLLERADAARIIHDGEISSVTDPPPDPPAPPGARTLLLKTAREQAQAVSWYILLDLAQYLKEYVPNVWRAVTQEAGFTLTEPNEINLLNLLENTRPPAGLATALAVGVTYTPTPSVPASLRAALQEVVAFAEPLDKVTDPYNRAERSDSWPTFFFPLADPLLSPPLPPTTAASTGDALRDAKRRVGQLAELVRQALPAQPASAMPTPALVTQQPLDLREGWFVIRCVYERAHCGPLEPPLLSGPTAPFQMAGFFDPDAPARPIRIGLPLDTSLAGLRKFDKNTAFMISDILCGQIDRVKALSLGDLVRSVLPWPLHKELSIPDKGPCKDAGGASIGTMCSFSLPIITLCALLMLMIIVSLLDLIFRWLPYFMICFPIPGFKGKKS